MLAIGWLEGESHDWLVLRANSHHTNGGKTQWHVHRYGVQCRPPGATVKDAAAAVGEPQSADLLSGHRKPRSPRLYEKECGWTVGEHFPPIV